MLSEIGCAGGAHQEGRKLDSIRRVLGYLKPNLEGNQWVGGPEFETLLLKPDVGPHRASRDKGVAVVGATSSTLPFLMTKQTGPWWKWWVTKLMVMVVVPLWHWETFVSKFMVYIGQTIKGVVEFTCGY
ncbi:hypothetical protein FRX31_007849 [Thalictrum thalictroides]|uniref:Uncharacterized protein n=1 Tax=Thalictrum thalictroides TaxID=46969 RepID=A0A7J6X2L7_THATH|nr:hypothetical protein FRX31_007849 [Thalictrum thalictroides]